MAEDWLATQADITADLRNDGTEFTIRRRPEAVYDPISGQYLPTGEEQKFTAYGIFKSLGSGKSSSSYNFAWQDGVTIQSGDKIVLLDCSTYNPELEDIFVLPTGEYSVKGYSFVEPGGIALIQYLLLRRA